MTLSISSEQEPLGDYEHYDIFPTLVLKTSLKRDISKEEETTVNNLLKECISNREGNSLTTDTYVLNHSGLHTIREEILKHAHTYLNYVYHPAENVGVRITQSWLNVTQKGQSHHEHNHTNSFISGVLYIQTQEDDEIEFQNPRTILEELQIDSVKWERYNARAWSIYPNTMDLLLFPSTLRHRVPIKQQEGHRVSLSFNTFLTGSLGAPQDCTELHLS
tara:strand:- start:119 stop:775 length:657 start_codon:yes stop_codon:yes gene_type:complete